MKKRKRNPSEAEQQWREELTSEASDQPQPETELDADFDINDEQWLKDLFASAEQAAEQEFVPTEPQESPLSEELQPTEESEIPAEDPVAETDEAAEEASGEAEETSESDDLTQLDPEMLAFLETIIAPENEPSDQPEDAEQMDAEANPEEAETPEDADEDEDTAPTKRRPKNKNGYGLFGIPHIMVTAVWLAIILMVGGFLGQWIWKGASDVLAFGREEKVVTITITESDDLDSIIDKLHSAGLINEPRWFRWYAQITDMMDEIGTGTFELNTLFDYRALVTHMSPNSSARVTVKVRIPEGKTCAEIFALLEEKGVCSAAALEAAAVGNELDNYWFLDGVTRDSKYCLEGYLFPDTYEFYVGDNAARVLGTLLSNFETRFTDIMMTKLEALNETLAEMMRKNGLSESYIQAHQYTLREVVIIASMIEKETAGAAESYTISSVIYNRLTNPEEHPYLNIDAALVYITGNSNLTEEDKAIDSPYNTYLYPGLIPGPICNPSRASLDAALDPSATDYYFYAYNPATYSHHFSVDYDEHKAFLDSLKKEETETP